MHLTYLPTYLPTQRDGWIFDHTLFGTRTYHRYEEDGLMYVLVDTPVDVATWGDVSCFEQIAVIKEAGR